MALKRILVALPMDGDNCTAIADRALQLTGQHGAALIAVHAIEGLPAADPLLPPPADARSLYAHMAAQRKSEVLALFGNAVSRVVVESGKPHAVIDALARTQGADLIVMGAGKAATLREKILGGTADRVVRTAPCPVLVVRGQTAAPYRHLTVGVDFSTNAKAAVRYASRMAPDAACVLLHAVEIPLTFEQAMLKVGTPQADIERYRTAKAEAARTALAQLYSANGRLAAGTRIRVQHGDAAALLLQAAQQGRTDLIAIGTQGANAVSQHLLGSVARKVLAGAACDVLVFPASAVPQADGSTAS